MTRPHAVSRRRCVMALGAAGLDCGAATGAPPLRLVYPRLSERPTQAYGYRLLQLALEHCGQPYELEVSRDPVSAQRALAMLEDGHCDVLDGGASPETVRAFLTVPFPLDFGLSGIRLCLIHRNARSRMDAIDSLAGLRRLRLGQGPRWIDVDILRAAGLRVDEAQFESLFPMLERQRFDALPLGLEEAHDHLRRFQRLAPSVEVYEHLAIRYRFARVFHVTPRRPELVAALLNGLQRAHAQGQMLAVLRSLPAVAAYLDGQRQPPRRIVDLPNPWWTGVLNQMPTSLFWRFTAEGRLAAPTLPSAQR